MCETRSITCDLFNFCNCRSQCLDNIIDDIIQTVMCVVVSQGNVISSGVFTFLHKQSLRSDTTVGCENMYCAIAS